MNTQKEIEIDIIPVAKCRMTRCDRWKKRDCVVKYFNFKDDLRYKSKGFNLADSYEITFILPFPKTYSKKKRELLNNTAHKVKPDYDNLLKGVMDFFLKSDSSVWKVNGKKIWGYEGKIIIKNLE